MQLKAFFFSFSLKGLYIESLQGKRFHINKIPLRLSHKYHAIESFLFCQLQLVVKIYTKAVE